MYFNKTCSFFWQTFEQDPRTFEGTLNIAEFALYTGTIFMTGFAMGLCCCKVLKKICCPKEDRGDTKIINEGVPQSEPTKCCGK